MDKRKVIAAYRKGHITLQECAQILGLHSARVVGMLDEATLAAGIRRRRKRAHS
jgi:predicted DNA-binding ArsR family transcriptional regulator